MNYNAAPKPQLPVPELYRYGDSGLPVEVFRKPDDQFDVRLLARSHAADPMAPDMGAIVILTRSNRTDGDGRHKEHMYFMDYSVIADPNAGIVQRLETAGAIDDIIIGQNWHSPFGITYPVRAIMRPHTRAVPSTADVNLRPGAPFSPPQEGLAWLNQNVS